MAWDEKEWAKLAAQAHQRGQLARQRAAEARHRLEQIEQREIVSRTPGGRARLTDARSAGRAAQRVEASYGRAGAAHLSAAATHELAGRAYDRAAEADPTGADEHRRRAEQQRARAEAARHHAQDEFARD